MKRMSMYVLAIGLVISACSPKTGMEIHQAWARPAAQGENSAIYFVIENHTSETQEMNGVQSDVAQAVEMHESRMSGDVMQMNQLETVSLEPGAEVAFEPGGLHVMLIGLQQELKTGDEIEMTLQFKDFEDLKVRVPVREMPGDAGDH